MAKKRSKSKSKKYGSARGAKHFSRLAKRGRASLAKRGKYRSQKRGKARRRAYLKRSKTRPEMRAYRKQGGLMNWVCNYRTMWQRGQRAGALAMRHKIDQAIKAKGLDPRKVYAANPRCTLTVPEKHQLRIARQTLRYPDAMAAVMGGPNKAEAKAIIARLACRGKYAKKKNPYELFYSSGGHGGPYKTIGRAREAAARLLKGGRDRSIEIRDRKGGYGKAVDVLRRESNPLVRGDKLPAHLKREVLNAYIYRWTKDNDRRESVWHGSKGKPTIPLISDEQWLREHAFHVTKAGKLNLRKHFAEPHYMADANPLRQRKGESYAAAVARARRG